MAFPGRCCVRALLGMGGSAELGREKRDAPRGGGAEAGSVLPGEEEEEEARSSQGSPGCWEMKDSQLPPPVTSARSPFLGQGPTPAVPGSSIPAPRASPGLEFLYFLPPSQPHPVRRGAELLSSPRGWWHLGQCHRAGCSRGGCHATERGHPSLPEDAALCWDPLGSGGFSSSSAVRSGASAQLGEQRGQLPELPQPRARSPREAQPAPLAVRSYQGTRIIFYSSVQIIYYIKITFLKNEYFGNNSGSPAEAFFKVP